MKRMKIMPITRKRFCLVVMSITGIIGVNILANSVTSSIASWDAKAKSRPQLDTQLWREVASLDNSGMFHINKLTVFPVFSLLIDPSYDLSSYGNEVPSMALLEERMLDFLESLQYSLDHPYVSEVIVMYSQDLMPGYITRHLGRHPKLSFDQVNSTYDVPAVLDYIHDNYQQRLVLLTNGDVYPAHGLEHINYELMKQKRLFYSPTRHGRQERRCDMGKDFCDEGHAYDNAHDTYIFIPMGPFPNEAKIAMKDKKWDFLGMEHVILYTYHTFMNYTVLNPCHVMFMYHNHCSKLRHSHRPRFADLTMFYDAYPSSQLK